MNVSVCIATFNGGKFIKRQLESILPQLSEEDEIIISDDSSTDETLNVIEALKEKRIKILKNNKFYNPAFNFQNAIYHSNKDIIILSDQDDVWAANKVAVIKKYLIEEKFDLIISDCTVVDENGKVIHDSFFRLINSRKGFFRNFSKNSYIGCCMAFNRFIYHKAFPLPKKTYMHDWWIGLISEIYGKVYFCNQKLVYYTRHSNNASNTSEKSKNSILKKITIRITLFINLILRILQFK